MLFYFKWPSPAPTVALRPPATGLAKSLPQSVPYKREDIVGVMCWGRRGLHQYASCVPSSASFHSHNPRIKEMVEAAGTTPIYESHLLFTSSSTYKKGVETCQEQQLILEHIRSYESHIHTLTISSLSYYVG